MPQPDTLLPKSVSVHARFLRLGPTGVPSLLAHPDWSTPAPVCIWMHGRTADKETDPGRYSRWLRAGIAVCAIDLPGHGERANPPRQGPEHSLGVIEQAFDEIDGIAADLEVSNFNGVFDLGRAAIGGISMGGMVALRRLCKPHRFACATVEATSGNLKDLYFPPESDAARPWPVEHNRAAVLDVDPSEHLAGFEPIPLLILHSESDKIIPWHVQSRFISKISEHYGSRGASPSMIEVRTWPQTGAPQEHVGFGRVSNDAKNAQTDFLARHLMGTSR